MARQIINTGTLALNGRDGDTNRDAADKSNANFAELYAADASFVKGPASAANGAIAVFSGTTGKVLSSVPAATFEPAQGTGTAAQYRNGLKALVDFAASVRASVLTGLSVATSAAITATDTVLSALGKIQAQLDSTGWGVLVAASSVADVNAVTESKRFGINVPASTLNIPVRRGTSAPFSPGSTGIVSAWATSRWQMLVFSHDSNDIVLRRSQAGIIQPDDYLTVYPTGKTYLDINQGGTGGNTQGTAQSALGLVPVSGTGDTTAGRLATVGWMGIGSIATPYWPDLESISGTRTFSFGAAQTANLISGMNYGQGIFLNGVTDADGSMILINHQSDRAFMKRKRSNVYYPGFEFHTTANSQLDPSAGTGGIISTAVVSGFRVDKYVNGSMCVTGKVSLASQGANTFAYQTLTLPVTFFSLANMVPALTCNANSTSDIYGVIFQRAASTSSVLYAVRNGATAQTFEVNVTVWGTWK